MLFRKFVVQLMLWFISKTAARIGYNLMSKRVDNDIKMWLELKEVAKIMKSEKEVIATEHIEWLLLCKKWETVVMRATFTCNTLCICFFIIQTISNT